jgi:hypothetical protein
MPDVRIPETHKLVLSVNDKPTMEQGMFQWLYDHGVAIVRARSMAKAMELLGRAHYDAVIRTCAVWNMAARTTTQASS